jgi:hypothetical protein
MPFLNNHDQAIRKRSGTDARPRSVWVLLVASSFLISSQASAQRQFDQQTGAAGASQSAAGTKKKADEFRPSFPVMVQMGASSNLYPIGSTDHSASLDLTLIPTYRFHPDWSTSLILAGSKELTDWGRFSLDRTDIAFGWRGRELNPYLRVSGNAAVILPFASERLVWESLLFGVRGGGRLGLNLHRLGVSFLSFGYEPSFARFFHTYTTNISGMPNPAFSVVQRVTTDIQLSSNWSAQVAVLASNAWTYGGTQADRFRVDGMIDYQVKTNVSISAGVATSGAQLRANGVDPNLAVFNPEISIVWASVGVSL